MFPKVFALILVVSSFSFSQTKRTIDFSPASVDFGSITTNTWTSRTARLTNTGTLGVKITGISSTSTDFVLVNVIPVPHTLAPGESFSLTITFAPKTQGPKNGSVVVTTNTTDPEVLPMAGSSIAPSAPLAISTSSLSAATVGAGYSATLSGGGGKAPHWWELSSGVLPNGLWLAADSGIISGTPLVTGTSYFTVALHDASGATVTRQLSLGVNAATAAPSASVSGGKVWGAIQSKPYSSTMVPSGGVAPFVWSVVSGSLPPGLWLDTARGAIQGTPTAAGTFVFTAQVRDMGTYVSTQTHRLIVSPIDPAYGNVGNAYATEGGGPDPSALLLSGCTGTTALSAGRSYRLTRNVSAASPADRCFTLNTGVRLDLGGFTVTGSLKMNGDVNGLAVFNGIIHCSVIDSGNVPGCLSLASYAGVTAAPRLHHLTITNTGAGTRSIHVDWPLPNKPAVTSLRMYNISALVPSQPAVSRSYAISFMGSNQTPEFFNNHLTCSAEAAACQGIMCFQSGDCKIHHNSFDLVRNTTSGDKSRAMLFDGHTMDGEAWNNAVSVHNNRGVRIRSSYNIRIHDNVFFAVEANGLAVIHLADPDGSVTDDLRALVDGNDFELAGGTVIFIRNGINATARNNRFTCTGLCSSSRFAYVRTPLTSGPATFSELTIENNPDVSLYMAPPPNRVDTGGVLNACNSGQVGGLGVVNNITCSP